MNYAEIIPCCLKKGYDSIPLINVRAEHAFQHGPYPLQLFLTTDNQLVNVKT